MEIIVVNGKTFVISKNNDACRKCLFYHGNNYPNSDDYCRNTDCHWFIVIREANAIDKIKMWFKKKIKL